MITILNKIMASAFKRRNRLVVSLYGSGISTIDIASRSSQLSEADVWAILEIDGAVNEGRRMGLN